MSAQIIDLTARRLYPQRLARALLGKIVDARLCSGETITGRVQHVELNPPVTAAPYCVIMVGSGRKARKHLVLPGQILRVAEDVA
jgi:hypothetical protein